jgi:transcriptional regulator with XRE-family HTH domain
MKSIDQIIANLPPQRRAKIEARTREVIGEELALQQLRKARRLTQKQMARFLGVGQDSISRLESRSDLLISTLQSYVEAMGGALKIVVEFKEGTTVLSGLGSDEPVKRSPKRAHDRKPSLPRKRATNSRTRAS